MANWRKKLVRLIDNVEDRFDALKYRLYFAMGGPGPIKIVPYRGYGTRDKLYLKGRVLEDKGVTPASKDDSVWDNLLNMYRRMQSDEIPFARLIARHGEVTQEVVADEEGMFDVFIEPDSPLSEGRIWHQIELELISPTSNKQKEPVKAVGQVFVPPSGAQFVVVSDIDDTVLQTNAVNLLRMARTVFLGNAHTRLPFPGVAALYRALHVGPYGDAVNPMFYVSSSPWNLYDLLSEFFHLQDIPLGPVLFLRNWGISEDELLPVKHRRYKLGVIRQMLDLYHEMPFILIGDSGQKDPEIYAEIVEAYPERVMAVYIRNVSRNPRRADELGLLAERVIRAGTEMVLADDSLSMAEHAAAHGWIAPEAPEEIGEEKHKDEASPTLVERLLSKEAGHEDTTVRVEAPEQGAEGADPRQFDEAATAVIEALDAGDKDEDVPPTVILSGKESTREDRDDRSDDDQSE